MPSRNRRLHIQPFFGSELIFAATIRDCIASAFALKLAAMLSWIAITGVLIVIFIVSVVTSHWEVIIALPSGAAAFLGALTGAGGGLLAIILGALVNAELNRRRDDRLRREQGRALALSLHGESMAVADSYRRHKTLLVESQKIFFNEVGSGHFKSGRFPLLTRLACSSEIFSKCSDRLGLLEDPELIRNLAHFYAAIPKVDETRSVEHAKVTEFCEGLMTLADEMAERAENLAMDLDRVAAQLAPPH